MKNQTSASSSPFIDQDILETLLYHDDIYELARKSKRYLSEPMSHDRLVERLESYLLHLRASAEATVLNHLLLEDHKRLPLVLCTEGNADWLWFSDQVQAALKLPAEQGLRKVLSACSDILSYCRPGCPRDSKTALEVMSSLEARFGFLSRCFGADGCFTIVFPSFSSPHDQVAFSFGKTVLGGAESRMTMVASPDNEPPKSTIHFLYLSAAYSLIALLGLTVPCEEELALLAETVAPGVFLMDPEEQVNAYVDALVMGLSCGGQIVAPDAYPEVGEEARLVWRDYVSDMIRKIGESNHSD